MCHQKLKFLPLIIKIAVRKKIFISIPLQTTYFMHKSWCLCISCCLQFDLFYEEHCERYAVSTFHWMEAYFLYGNASMFHIILNLFLIRIMSFSFLCVIRLDARVDLWSLNSNSSRIPEQDNSGIISITYVYAILFSY